MKRQDESPAPKRKKRRGRRKSKAERLAHSTPASSSPDDLHKLLQGSSSLEWDAAQSLALRLGTPEARIEVVRTILKDREAPRAAAHYAKRLNMRGEELLSAVPSDSTISPLVLAQFLVELDEDSLTTEERLQRFLWPWLRQTMEKKEDKAVVKAAVHLILHPTASDDTKAQGKREQGRRLERALVTKCLVMGKLLHLVPAHARAFGDCISIESTVDLTEEKGESDVDEAMGKELQRRKQVARRVQNVLRLIWPDARVLVFGSSVTGLLPLPDKDDGSSADVDLCALLPSAPQFRQETAPLVTELKEHLMLYLLPDTDEEIDSVTAITGARVPIVHFRDPSTGFPCDLCVNNVPALWNTRLLRWMLYGGANTTRSERMQLEQVRQLCKWLRKWRQTKKRVVTGALSSYGLMLLALYYLQRIGVLPVVDCSVHCVEDESALRALSEKEIDDKLEAADKTFVKKQADSVQDWQALRRGFFRFYTCEFDYEHNVVSLRTREVMSKTSKGWSRQNNTRLCLEDPVETERDLGSLCSRLAFGRLRCAFAHACVVLSKNEDGQEPDLLTSWGYEEENALVTEEDSHETMKR
ncbi:UTP:RNA uridylyltransferase 1 [Phytophthora citrophthora]|uniref:UTP:RNA uridylyltransferase 1 n=1 Tax=Phytophthora citrophthora TaxID=4793 RepID=A0AAD9G488_9STRA|nr:UTP:RNA uridylyltransferase 1 [Phytophthora citrophthora]